MLFGKIPLNWEKLLLILYNVFARNRQSASVEFEEENALAKRMRKAIKKAAAD
jgi:hypothetical protein